MRDLIEKQLALSEAMIRGGEPGYEMPPRFVIETPNATVVAIVPLPPELAERTERFALVKDFMAWKLARAFLCCTELQEPDAIVAISVARDEICGGLKLIRRRPLTFSPLRWLSAEECGDEVPAMLPKRQETFTTERLALMERLFGANGLFAPKPWR